LNPELFHPGTIVNPYVAFDRPEMPLDPLNLTLAADQAELLPNQILPFVDRLSMAHSIEVRCPFLDHHLVDFVNRLPGDYKIRGGVTKYVLREALSGLLPDDVLNRAKEGFVQPIYTWMQHELRAWILDLLAALPAEMFKPAALLKVSDAWRKGDQTLNAKIWNLACFSIWWNSYDHNV